MESKLLSNRLNAPWADELRACELVQFVGQSHLVGPNGALNDSKLHSMLLWGPPGCGKTTLARLLASKSEAHFESISPVTAGVKELRVCVSEASIRHDEQGQHTVLFVDEAHRFNKSQQDYFLPHVESGLLIFIGATTENPSFEINSALLSRLSVYKLDPLSNSELATLLEYAAKVKNFSIDDQARALVLDNADGDARRLLNTLEQLVNVSPKIDEKMVLQLNLAKLRRHDKKGDEFYDQISALIKSVRGSNPDATLYWLCRMLDGGAPPEYISRRLIRLATEDIGLADPQALNLALNADQNYRLLGSPEGELGLAMAAVYMACCPKSNAIYKAFKKVSKEVSKTNTKPVPKHLRNAPTKLMKDQGNSIGYRYAHEEPEAFAAGQSYLPDGMKALDAYQPTSRGFEAKVKTRMNHLRSLEDKDKQ